MTSKVYTIDTGGRLSDGLKALLTHYGIQVSNFTSPQGFLQATATEQTARNCLLYVLQSDCESGLPVVKDIRSSRPDAAIIVLCDSPTDSLRAHYTRAGAIDLVSKSMVDAYVFTRLSATLGDAAPLPFTQPSTMCLADNTLVTFRMINPDDAEIERQFVNSLSDRSRYLRFFSGFRKLPDHMLKRLVDPEFPISYALIATISSGGSEQQIGVARYAPTELKGVAEFAVVVADAYQGHGIASQLMRGIITAATVAGLDSLEGLIMRENTSMLKLAHKLGFVESPEPDADPAVIKVVKVLH